MKILSISDDLRKRETEFLQVSQNVVQAGAKKKEKDYTSQNHFCSTSSIVAEISTQLKLFDYVIVSVDTTSGSVKYYIGQISGLHSDEEIEINFLKKTKSKFGDKYSFPENCDKFCVRKNKIMQILKMPSINRRKQLIFEDLKTSNFTIE